MNLDRDTLNEIVTLLMPLMPNEQRRRALLTQALTGKPVLDSIEYSGPTRAFVVQLIEQLADYGEVGSDRTALWTLMETVRDMVGEDKQKRIDKLRDVCVASQKVIGDQEENLDNQQVVDMFSSKDTAAKAIPPKKDKGGKKDESKRIIQALQSYADHIEHKSHSGYLSDISPADLNSIIADLIELETINSDSEMIEQIKWILALCYSAQTLYDEPHNRAYYFTKLDEIANVLRAL